MVSLPIVNLLDSLEKASEEEPHFPFRQGLFAEGQKLRQSHRDVLKIHMVKTTAGAEGLGLDLYFVDVDEVGALVVVELELDDKLILTFLVKGKLVGGPDDLLVGELVVEEADLAEVVEFHLAHLSEAVPFPRLV